MTISLRPLVAAIVARGATISNAAPYLSEPINVPLKLDGDGDPNTDGLVVPYFVIHPFVGTRDLEVNLADTSEDMSWPFQVTVASSDPEDVLPLVDRVMAAYYRWTPAVAGLVCGPCKPPPGYEPGPPRPDRDYTPHRFFVPLQFVTTITAT